MDVELKRKTRLKAVLTATAVGYVGVFIVDFFQWILPGVLAGEHKVTLETFTIFGLLYLIFGLPIALLSCPSIGVIIWNFLHDRNRFKAQDSIVSGMLFGGILWGVLGWWAVHTFSAPIIIFDAVSTIIIGGAAGYAAYKVTQKSGLLAFVDDVS